MQSASSLTIALDAGHGGWDSGAQDGDRREKDDNLRLAMHVNRELRARGLGVFCTRTDDSFISLAERARIANEKDADLFISLHRGAFPTKTEEAVGVAGYIYPTASLETSGRAAQLALSALEEAGVQRMVGISRGNSPVLRRAEMPAFMLEVGFITNREDNRLFDQNLDDYAKAIAKGVADFFGLSFDQNPPQGIVSLPIRAARDENAIFDMQQLLVARYGFGLKTTGRFDSSTRRALVVALQIELNGTYDAQIPVNGEKGPQTLAAIRPINPGEKGGLCALLQVMLILNGYEPGDVDGEFGRKTATALRFFQRDHFMTPDSIASAKVLLALIGG